jgi:predicted nucleic acid-binding protein
VKVVVDTNVVAYLLLGTTAFVDEARRALHTGVDLLAPAHWEAELTNVLWMAVRSGVLAPAEGAARFSLARRLGIETVSTSPLCQGALLRSLASGISVYDTLFVELAARTECHLVTFDKAVLKAFPKIAVRPRELPQR